jgi:hypothetical protein
MINRMVRGLFASSGGQERKLDEEVKRKMQEKINERLPPK